jgi:hypothetical protein
VGGDVDPESILLGSFDTLTQDQAESCVRMYFPLFLALSFSNCKNVRHEKQIPTDNRIRRERRRDPRYSYYTLLIDPMRQVLNAEGNAEANGLKTALHICRGHFRRYDEKPLFGRYRGAFWTPAHIRGTVERGVVVKDYRVKAPNQETTHG